MSRRQRTRRPDIDARARWLARRRNRPKLHWAVALQARDADGSQRKEIVPLLPLTVTQARSIIQSIDADLEAGRHPTIEVGRVAMRRLWLGTSLSGRSALPALPLDLLSLLCNMVGNARPCSRKWPAMANRESKRGPENGCRGDRFCAGSRALREGGGIVRARRPEGGTGGPG